MALEPAGLVTTPGGTRKYGDVTVVIGTGQGPRGDRPAVSPLFRNVLARNHWPTVSGATTLYELFERSVVRYFNCKCLGWRPVLDGAAQPYKWMTYQETRGIAGHRQRILSIAGPFVIPMTI